MQDPVSRPHPDPPGQQPEQHHCCDQHRRPDRLPYHIQLSHQATGDSPAVSSSNKERPAGVVPRRRGTAAHGGEWAGRWQTRAALRVCCWCMCKVHPARTECLLVAGCRCAFSSLQALTVLLKALTCPFPCCAMLCCAGHAQRDKLQALRGQQHLRARLWTPRQRPHGTCHSSPTPADAVQHDPRAQRRHHTRGSPPSRLHRVCACC
jgi:hypothetical protein